MKELLEYIELYINKHLSNYKENKIFHDKEFDKYNKNHEEIRVFYSLIKYIFLNKNVFGYQYKTVGYGFNKLRKMPTLFNDSSIIVFFSSSNRLNNNFLSLLKEEGKDICIIKFKIFNFKNCSLKFERR